MVPGDYAPLCAQSEIPHIRQKLYRWLGSASLWNQKHPDSDFYDDLVVKKLA